MKIFILVSAISLLLVSNLNAQTEIRKKEFNLTKNTLAISGYDPVAYFTQHKAVEGNKNITYAYEGVTYRFLSEQNKALFITKPGMYEPQYGGWCAYAMGTKGEKVEVDPETFKIVDNKLYLFYNKYFNNTLKSWNKEESALMTKADANWKKFVGKP